MNKKIDNLSKNFKLCEYCDKAFTAQGLGSHKYWCKKKKEVKNG